MQGQTTLIGLLGPETAAVKKVTDELRNWETRGVISNILTDEHACKIKQKGGIIIHVINSVQTKDVFKPTAVMRNLIDAHLQVLDHSNWKEALKDIITAHDNIS